MNPLFRTVSSAANFSAAKLYLFFASLMVLITVLLTPPGAAPDEAVHFLRAVQISQGGLIGLRRDNQSGGMLPASIRPVLLSTQEVLHDPGRHASLPALTQVASLPWGETYDFMDFRGAAIYAPGAYLPEAIAIRASRLVNLSVLQTFYIARLTNGALTLLLRTAAIALSRRGTAWLLLLASLPMTLHLAGSCSHDGVLTGVALLAAALLTRCTPATRWSTGRWLGISTLFALLAMAKPPLLLSALFPAAFATRKTLRPLLPFAISFLATGLWFFFGIAPVKIQFLPQGDVSDSGQVRWMLLHPLKTLFVAAHTLATSGPNFACQMIGRLGWLDTPLSRPFYVLAGLCLVLSFLSGALWKGATATRQNTRATVITLAVGALSTLGMMLALYVIWSPVGSGLISGIQGRYFLTLLPFCALLLPAMPEAGRLAPGLAAHRTGLVLLAAFLSVDTLTLAHALLARFW